MEKCRRTKRIWSRRAPHPLCLPTNLRFAGEISRLLVYAPLRGLRRPAIGTGMYFSVSHRPSIQHGRSAPSHRAAFSGPVFRGCALRFAPCARHFNPSGLRRSQARLQLSLLTGLTTRCFAHRARASCAPQKCQNDVHAVISDKSLFFRGFVHTLRGFGAERSHILFLWYNSCPRSIMRQGEKEFPEL